MATPAPDPALVTTLAEFAADCTFDSLPADVVLSTRSRLFDTLGICLAARARGLGDGAAAFATEIGAHGAATVVGGGQLGVGGAAFVNGVLAHSLDFDDTHLPSVLHPSASIVPAGLATGQAIAATARDIINAIAIGIELTVRIGMGGYTDGTNHFFERGWHATSICGTLGAAATAARLHGRDAKGIADAIGIAASMAGGLLEANRAGGTVKRLHCGLAAQGGINAAQLAAHGYTAPASVLEGRFGFYQAYVGGEGSLAAVTEGLGTQWELPGIYFKPYPANHYTHAAIDAAMAIRQRRQIHPDEVVRIELGAAEAALRTIGEPRAEKIRPRSGYHAQFSGPFTVAAALVGGGGLGVWLDDFTDARAQDPVVLGLAERVETFVDAACDAAFPTAFAAIVRVHLTDGSVEEERVMENRGGPQRPLTMSELREKFRLNAGLLLDPAEVERLDDETLAFGGPDGPSVAGLLALTEPRRATGA